MIHAQKLKVLNKFENVDSGYFAAITEVIMTLCSVDVMVMHQHVL